MGKKKTKKKTAGGGKVERKILYFPPGEKTKEAKGPAIKK